MKKSKMVELALSVVPKSEQAEAQGEDGCDVLLLTYQEIERFAALVAEKEREACAKLAQSTVCDTHIPTGVKIYGTAAAKAIRARGETK
jgi:hypothetical protein